MSKPPILPANPKASYLAHKQEIDQAIQGVLDSGWYILGQETSAFEQAFAEYLGVQFTVGAASGTDALHLALKSCGVGPGDGVLTVSHTAVATVAAIELAGARPVLVDMNPETFTLDPQHAIDTLANLKDVKAIVPVHLYGHPADMSAIAEVAERHGLFLIEDCAQAHGATILGQKVGGWGHWGVFSFYPTKNLGALGDAGALVTNDSDLAERARQLREYGWVERYVSDFEGMNTRMDEIQAGVLNSKLPYLDVENHRRREIATLYNRLLSNTDLKLPSVRDGMEHVFHQYVVRTPNRDDLRAFLSAREIGTLIHYPVPVHLQPAYRDRLEVGPGGLPHTERACLEILSLPMYPQMTDDQVHLVCEPLGIWCSQQKSS